MRRSPLLAALAALLAVPAVGLAHRAPAGSKVPGGPAAAPGPIDDPRGVLPDGDAGAVPGQQTTDKALHAQGRGTFIYRGSGGTTISLNAYGVLFVRDLSTGAPLAAAPTGVHAQRTSRDGRYRVFTGRGTLVLDGASYRVEAFSRSFAADVAPTAANRAVGVARAFGRGETILQGGAPVRFARSHRIILSHGPLRVNLSGRGYWRVGGPANGTVAMTVSNRFRVWDLSAAKDLKVTGIDPERTKTLADGSVLYWGLRDAHVTVAGTGFRMRVRSTDVEGTFTPAPGTLARSGVRGFGSYSTGATEAPEQQAYARRAVVTRILLQP
jgi:hypothetical protein